MSENISSRALSASPQSSARRGRVADDENWDGTRVNFCKSRGISRKTFQAWRRKTGLVRGGADRSDRFVEVTPGPGRDIELSLGGGVVLRLRQT